METAATPPPSPQLPRSSGALRLHAAFGRLADRLRSPFALAIRLYVAKIFFTSGLIKASNWEGTLALFENEFHVPVLSPQVAAVLGTAAELGLPVLLALGLGTRLTAAALFAFNVVAVISYPDLSDAGFKDHLLWGALLLVTFVYGPGRLALDRWLGDR
jgi:putative oxidoreductase